MAVAVADVRSRDELVGFIEAGGRAKYLFFWGHQPQADGSIGMGAGNELASCPEHWRGLNLLGFALMAARRQLTGA